MGFGLGESGLAFHPALVLSDRFQVNCGVPLSCQDVSEPRGELGPILYAPQMPFFFLLLSSKPEVVHASIPCSLDFAPPLCT